jgi:2-methylcitrate dehydratase PrpD
MTSIKSVEKSGSSMVAEQFSALAVTQQFEDLPPETVTKAKELMLDISGCIIGAAKTAQGTVIAEVARSQGGLPQSSVLGHGFKTSAMNAALANGLMGHVFDYDDDHREGTLHPSVVIFPAVLALGEYRKVSGKNLIKGFVLGSEADIRLGEAFLGKGFLQGFHPTSTCGVFGAALAGSVMLDLDAKRTIYAIGLAGSLASGTWEWKAEGSWQKPLNPGHAAMGGVLAALMAEKGFVGTRSIIEGHDGFLRAFSYQGQYDLAVVTNRLGEKWEMLDTSIKVHAGCRFAASVADCSIDLYRRGLRPQDIKNIVVKVSKFIIDFLCNPPEVKYRPKNHVEGQFSIPYVLSVGILKGKIGVEEYNKEMLDNPVVLELAAKVRWEVDPKAEALYPKAYPATVIVELKNGQKMTSQVDFPKGDPENPASVQEIEDKFNSLVCPIYSKIKINNYISKMKTLEKVSDINELTGTLSD